MLLTIITFQLIIIFTSQHTLIVWGFQILTLCIIHHELRQRLGEYRGGRRFWWIAMYTYTGIIICLNVVTIFFSYSYMADFLVTKWAKSIVPEWVSKHPDMIGLITLTDPDKEEQLILDFLPFVAFFTLSIYVDSLLMNKNYQ
jgi:hypothetical protein